MMTNILILNSPVIFPSRRLSRNEHVEINIKICLLVVSVVDQVMVMATFLVVADLMLEDKVLMVPVTDLVPMVKQSVIDTKEDI